MTEFFFDVEQGSPEWFQLRLGIPTASRFADVLAGRKGAAGDSKMRNNYLYDLAGEQLCGQPAETYVNAAMERGKAMEAEARELYAFASTEDVRRVGFVRNTLAGASPDALVGEYGVLEIKTAIPRILISHHENGHFPAAHVAQAQGCLWLTGREWCDLIVYWPKMKPFIKRLRRNDGYCQMLEEEIERFDLELRRLVERLRQ